MRPINTKIHGIIDYGMGVTLLCMPLLLNLNLDTLQSNVFFSMGTTLLVYSFMTKYELGFLNVIPINIHLMLDVISGIFLAGSPWLLGFASEVFLPHLLLGLIEIGVATSTNPRRVKYF